MGESEVTVQETILVLLILFLKETGRKEKINFFLYMLSIVRCNRLFIFFNNIFYFVFCQ